MQDEQRNQLQAFSLMHFVANSLRLLRRTFYLVLLAAILGAVGMAVYTQQTYVPTYQSRAVLSVHVDRNTITDILSTDSTANSRVTQQIISTFPMIIQTDAMREHVRNQLGVERINGTILPTVIAESNLYTLTVTSSSPSEAYLTLQAILDYYPELAYMIIGAARIELIEPPTIPSEPVKSLDLVHPAIYGGAIAGLIVLAILCLLAQMQQHVLTTEDMKRYSNVPCIVHVPHVEPKRRKNRQYALSLLNSSILPAYEDSIRVLRARILRQLGDQMPQKIVITSTSPGEGKSTLSANLALSLGRSGYRVILVDADLRAQDIREFFHLEGTFRGLGDLLKSDEEDIVSCLTPVPDTHVQLLCGSQIDHPMGLLRPERVKALLCQLERVADIILIDTPPIGILSDAAFFAQCADAALYVVRPDENSGNHIADALQELSDSNVKLLGYVLNGVSTRSGNRYGYGYRYRYGYGYGYGGNYGGNGSSAAYGAYSTRGGYSGYGAYGGYGGYGNYGGYGGYGSNPEEDEKTANKAPDDTRKKASKDKKETTHRSRSRKGAEADKQEPKDQEGMVDGEPAVSEK